MNGGGFMEHRWSARKPITGNVIVECPRVGLVRAVMRDVGLGGMFVENSTVNLPLNAPVSVIFDLPESGRGDGYCLQAMIVRRNANGAGIMFLDPEPDVLRSMRTALFGKAATSESRLADSSGSRLKAVSRARAHE